MQCEVIQDHQLTRKQDDQVWQLGAILFPFGKTTMKDMVGVAASGFKFTRVVEDEATANRFLKFLWPTPQQSIVPNNFYSSKAISRTPSRWSDQLTLVPRRSGTSCSASRPRLHTACRETYLLWAVFWALIFCNLLCSAWKSLSFASAV